jgi:hypothetical protein
MLGHLALSAATVEVAETSHFRSPALLHVSLFWPRGTQHASDLLQVVTRRGRTNAARATSVSLLREALWLGNRHPRRLVAGLS